MTRTPETTVVFRSAGRAVCAETDPEVFFPKGGLGHLAAIAVCEACPLIVECREYALANDVLGIWGGTSYSHRLRIRKAAGIVAAPMVTTDELSRTPDAVSQRALRAARKQGRTPASQSATCGTHNGHNWHVNHNETPCDPCKAAERVYNTGRRKKQRARARREQRAAA